MALARCLLGPLPSFVALSVVISGGSGSEGSGAAAKAAKWSRSLFKRVFKSRPSFKLSRAREERRGEERRALQRERDRPSSVLYEGKGEGNVRKGREGGKERAANNTNTSEGPNNKTESVLTPWLHEESAV